MKIRIAGILVTILATAVLGFASPAAQPGKAQRFRVPLMAHDDVNVCAAPYRAKADGKVDDTPAFQRALDDVSRKGGGIVYVPAGTYLIATHLTIPAGTTLMGVARAPQTYDPKQPGSLLLAVEGAGNPDGPALITLAGPNSTLEGISILYPHQQASEHPIPYPWTIRGGGGNNVALVNVLLVNPYQAVDFATHTAARHFIDGLYGQPLYRGIQVDQCYDIGRIKDVHFWPFWSLNKDLIRFTTRHAIAYTFDRTDWEVVENIFCWGYHVGIRFGQSAHGGMNGQLSDINLDNVDIGLDVRNTQPYGIHISNLNIANAGGGTHHVAILGEDQSGKGWADIDVRGASFWGELKQAVRWDIGGVLSISDSRFVNWDRRLPAVAIERGDLIFHDNFFHARKGMAVCVGAGAKSFVVHDNLLNGNLIDKKSCAGWAPAAEHKRQ